MLSITAWQRLLSRQSHRHLASLQQRAGLVDLEHTGTLPV